MGDEERILYTEGVQKRRKRNRAVGTFASDDQQLESTNDGRRMQRTNYLLMAQMNSYFHQASQPKRRDQRKKYIKSFLTKLLNEVPYTTEEIEKITEECLPLVLGNFASSLDVLKVAKNFKLFQVWLAD
ncbi:hypothetical protein QJS10_CPA09g01618 [Acorus calamus]|uniref:Uncharacterized protein n=1 Tax=Acorus calamus TaxID=4465 RepID=A0AAV9E4Z4_ACOCL|nr:hypothetical protein QJS10_CPA09g01618 [Acorus calamus]